LIFGGVYSNLAALKAFTALAHGSEIPPTNMICTGDVVAYCAEAQGCVDHIRALNCPVLAGNCEVQLAVGSEDCGCGFAEDSTCSLLSKGWYEHARKDVTLESKAWMKTRPDRIVFTHRSKRYGVIHGGARDISKFIWPVSSDQEIEAEIHQLQQQIGPVDCVIAGHSGIAMDRTINGVRWINSGAIGMPPNDGDYRGAFARILRDDVRFERFAYDVQATRNAMVGAGLTQGYHEAVETGYWPSEDTLPEEMRVQSSAKG